MALFDAMIVAGIVAAFTTFGIALAYANWAGGQLAITFEEEASARAAARPVKRAEKAKPAPRPLATDLRAA